MLLDKYDSYYTPDSVANRLVGLIADNKIERCFDSNCGDGGLLRAAARHFNTVKCIGLDKNEHAIEELRRRQPQWSLWLGDTLCSETWSRNGLTKAVRDVDLVVMNPPFSMKAQKGILGPIDGVRRSSVAMAHVLTTLENVHPSYCAAIVPESFCYSELDDQARRWIADQYEMIVHAELQNTTFSGTRANALLVTLSQRCEPVSPSIDTGTGSARVTRGGLPLHESRPSRNGLPLIHSTALRPLSRNDALRLPRVKSIARGVVSGHVILVPRVGNLVRDAVVPLHLGPSQLSDCVLAMSFCSRTEAEHAHRTIMNRWNEFSCLWRGTGARYVTVGRFTEWVARHLGS